jgi:hypothetical protein
MAARNGLKAELSGRQPNAACHRTFPDEGSLPGPVRGVEARSTLSIRSAALGCRSTPRHTTAGRAISFTRRTTLPNTGVRNCRVHSRVARPRDRARDARQLPHLHVRSSARRRASAGHEKPNYPHPERPVVTGALSPGPQPDPVESQTRCGRCRGLLGPEPPTQTPESPPLATPARPPRSAAAFRGSPLLLLLLRGSPCFLHVSSLLPQGFSRLLPGSLLAVSQARVPPPEPPPRPVNRLARRFRHTVSAARVGAR